MSTQVILDIEVLRRVVNTTLDRCERKFGQSVDLDADSYWLIETPDAFDPSRVPEIACGGLADDIESLMDIDGTPAEDDFDPIWHRTQHVIGPLLRLAALDYP